MIMLVCLQFHCRYWVIQLLEALLRELLEALPRKLQCPPSSIHFLQPIFFEVDRCDLFMFRCRCRSSHFGFLRSPTPFDQINHASGDYKQGCEPTDNNTRYSPSFKAIGFGGCGGCGVGRCTGIFGRGRGNIGGR